jgi:predicted unusual protein kinase regulating ubiquinone biosynthesis (AarF/ABC1/UbiB family)
MAELPRKSVARTAKLAALPLGYAGRTALGLGKRLGGASAETVLTDIQQRTAEQLFRTLGELKGGAMKAGQAMSIFEAALPEELTRALSRKPPAPARFRAPDADHHGA